MSDRVIAEHPAKFSAEIMQEIVRALEQFGESVIDILDPFAGVGTIHTLREHNRFWATYAIELQPEWASHAGHIGPTICADFLTFKRLPLAYGYFPHQFDAIVTSPAYGNRMADKHNAREDSKRMTYAHTLRRNGGELVEGSAAGMQWGDEYRLFHEVAWKKCVRLLVPGGLLILNVKDHVRRGKLMGVPEWHRDVVLSQDSMTLVMESKVPVKGMGFGANQSGPDAAKVDYEMVYVFRKDADA